jgi:HEPN domain-containing protein
MKQTAVEWLLEQLRNEEGIDFIPTSFVNQAKAMEKEQIEDAYWDGYQNIPSMKPEQYYKETYSK